METAPSWGGVPERRGGWEVYVQGVSPDPQGRLSGESYPNYHISQPVNLRDQGIMQASSPTHQVPCTFDRWSGQKPGEIKSGGGE